jgi:hypothetical protein
MPLLSDIAALLAGRPLARLRRFAAEQQEVTWCCVQFGVEGAGRSGSGREKRKGTKREKMG